MLLRFAPWKMALIVGALLLGALMCLPNLISEADRAKYMGWWPTRAVNLGLDLKGGASILLEVDPVELRANELRNVSRMVAEKLRETPRIPVTGRNVTGDAVIITLANESDRLTALDRLKQLSRSAPGQSGGEAYIITESAGSIQMRFTDTYFSRLLTNALNSSVEAVRRRADNSGLVEPNIQKQGDNRVLVEVPGLNPQEMNTLIDTLTKTGVLTFNMVDTQALPAEYQLNVPKGNPSRVLLPHTEEGQQPQVVFVDAIITGADLSGASQATDQYNRPSISFQLHSSGAKKFGDASSRNVGQFFAIVLDDRIVSAPRIESPILTGNGQITGSFTQEEAEQLAIVLRSGALPAKLKVVERRVVDASLGRDSINAGVTASVVGVGLVAVFMIVAYGLLGVFAVIALLCNAFMMIGVLSGMHATLTLPGIAGILLTMGMAVDYNVLIFERIREEKKAGRSPVTSVEAGYDHAMATIVDANVTHLVAAGTMFFLGSGPVKGFALTLAIGVLTSIFTAVIVARWIMAAWLRFTRPKWIPI